MNIDLTCTSRAVVPLRAVVSHSRLRAVVALRAEITARGLGLIRLGVVGARDGVRHPSWTVVTDVALIVYWLLLDGAWWTEIS